MNGRALRVRAIAALLLAAAATAPAARAGGDAPVLSGTPFEDVLKAAMRYGDTPARAAAKEAARRELKARGAAALRELLARAHVRNVMIHVYAQELVEALPREESLPPLLDALSSTNVETRASAAFFLGFVDAPERAADLYPLLDVDRTRGAAIRTLGRWKAREAVGRIRPFAADPKERVRVTAMNALHDIGEPSAAPSLIAGLGDEFFTVRHAAARALEALGADAEGPLLEALPSAAPPARRAIVRALGRVGGPAAAEALRPLAADPDSEMREDARRALDEIARRE
jgi:HEAT repeat protein